MEHLDDQGERYRDDPRLEVVENLPPGRKILDVGCSRGAFGAEIKRRRPDYLVYGLEPTAATGHARGRLDDVVQGFYPDDLPDSWGRFDIVCFNDVLEHMADPWKVLSDTKRVLTAGGYAVASLPNVRYIEVLSDLAIRGEWRYQDTGVLDRSHVRFFTRKSMERLFQGAGFQVVRIVATHLGESQRRPARALRRLHLEQRFEDILTQRYLGAWVRTRQ